jgi:hypothetical protein
MIDGVATPHNVASGDKSLLRWHRTFVINQPFDVTILLIYIIFFVHQLMKNQSQGCSIKKIVGNLCIVISSFLSSMGFQFEISW